MKSKSSKWNFVLITLLVIIGLFGTIFYFSSCKKDPCKGVTCENGGSSVSSGENCTCNCGIGYEGDRCQTKTRDKLIGEYNVSGALCKIGAISASSSFADRINISISGVTFYATVSGNNITIPSQPFGAGCSPMFCEGSGTINSSGSNLTITHTLNTTGTAVPNCCFAIGTYTVTWTKK